MRAWILTLLVVFLSVAPTAHATGLSQPSGFSMGFSSDSARVSLTVRLFQNLTLIDQSFSLPQGNSMITGSNATPIANIFENALRAKSTSASVQDLSGTVGSSAWNSTTGAQWMNVTVSFDVNGIAQSRNGATQFDVAWRSFAVPSNITVSGVEVNEIGAVLLHPFVTFLQGLKNSKIITFTYRVNGLAIAQSRIQDVVQSMRLLNFSSLSTPLSEWAPTYNQTSNSATWSLRPLPTYGITVVEIVTEVEATTLKYELSYSFEKATITTPLRASVKGDTIFVSFGDSIETLMTAIIATVSAAAIGTTLYEKRLIGKVPMKRSRH